MAHPPAILNQAAEKAVVEEVTEFRKSAGRCHRDARTPPLPVGTYADAFVHTHGSGKIDGKDARIVSALAGDPVIETAPVTDFVVRVPAAGRRLPPAISPIKSMADGKTYSFRWTAVYVRVGDGWQIAASQATRLAEVK